MGNVELNCPYDYYEHWENTFTLLAHGQLSNDMVRLELGILSNPVWLTDKHKLYISHHHDQWICFQIFCCFTHRNQYTLPTIVLCHATWINSSPPPYKILKSINDEHVKYLFASKFWRKQSNLVNWITFVVGSNVFECFCWLLIIEGLTPRDFGPVYAWFPSKFNSLSEFVSMLNRFGHLFYKNSHFSHLFTLYWTKHTFILNPHKCHRRKSIIFIRVIGHVNEWP